MMDEKKVSPVVAGGIIAVVVVVAVIIGVKIMSGGKAGSAQISQQESLQHMPVAGKMGKSPTAGGPPMSKMRGGMPPMGKPGGGPGGPGGPGGAGGPYGGGPPR